MSGFIVSTDNDLTLLITLFNMPYLVSLIKYSRHEDTYSALSLFEVPSSLQPPWSQLLQRRGQDVQKETNGDEPIQGRVEYAYIELFVCGVSQTFGGR
jgi:hypothetical protein